jgi:hypothetical protein
MEEFRCRAAALIGGSHCASWWGVQLKWESAIVRAVWCLTSDVTWRWYESFLGGRLYLDLEVEIMPK